MKTNNCNIWILHNKLKASILIAFIDQFYYRLVSVLYNILNEDGYFYEDDYD